MGSIDMKKAISTAQLVPVALAMVGLLLTTAAPAAVPGITGPTFNLVATPEFVTQPDGNFVYSWGYGCDALNPPAAFVPANVSASGTCSTMQVPGPTLIVTEGQTVTVNLTNNLPTSAGNTSILFPGFTLTSATGAQGLLTKEAAQGTPAQYIFTATTPGTHTYYSGTQGDLQIDMGLYGAIIVLPSSVPAACDGGVHASNVTAQAAGSVHTVAELDNRLAHAAYDHAGTCYDREYLFQFSEMDLRMHREAEEQVAACGATAGCTLHVATEPYFPTYFMINGRSMPDNMDGAYVPQYPHQPYNGNPHMHPGELVLLRIVGQGRWQHPFHEHGNHVRVLARDGNLILSATDANSLAGPLLFTTTTTPGQAIDGIFYWTGKGMNWDEYGHGAGVTTATCTPDENGYNTGSPTAINYFEWCQDHNKPMQAAPFGSVGGGGPVSLPDPNILANGAWYGGSPYLGPDATIRAVGSTGTTPPSGTVANSPTDEAGFAFMLHSHNERAITNNNGFPGGMVMMMIVDFHHVVIDESN